MKIKSLGINAILNGFRSVLNIIFPLITFPYVSRVLGVQNLGIYNFTLSVTSYFMLIAMLGINSYAIREGSKYRENREQISKFASEVFTINLFFTIIAYIALFICLLLASELQKYTIIIFVFSIQIFFTTIGVDWIYSIYEEYTYITIRSIVCKLISLLLLFVFVRKSEDYILYAAITVFASAGSNLFNFFHAKKYCSIHILHKFDWRKHLNPILVIFAYNIATIIYVNSDITMLGFVKGDYSVGIYSVAVKIYNVVKNLLAAILIVCIPRLSMLFGKEMIVEYKQTLRKIFNALVLIMTPVVVGLFFVSDKVVLIIAGEEYIQAVDSLKLLSIALIFSLFAWLFSQCVLLPAKKEKTVLIISTISAVTNVVLNFILIPIWSEKAAAFTTIIAELIMAIGCSYYAIKVVQIKGVWENVFSTTVGCVAISFVCITISLLNIPLYVSLGLSVCISAIAYISTLLFLRNQLVNEVFRKILIKIAK